MLNLMNKSLPNTITVDGKDFLLNTDFRIWMRFVTEYKSFRNNGAKGVLDIKYLFETDIPAFTVFEDYEGIFEFAFPKNIVPHSESGRGEDVLFYNIDGDYIYAAFLQAYNVDLVESDMHWHKFLALLNGLPETTRLVAIMGYRAYTGEKVKNESQIYRRLKEMWMPPYEETEDEKKAEEEFNKYFGG